MEARTEERLLDAAAVTFGIAQALGGGKALRDYRRMLQGTGSAARGDTENMAKFRKQVAGILKLGQTKP